MVVVRAWLFGLLTALLVLLPGQGSVRVEHFCRMAGRVVASCCCDEAATASSPGEASPGAAQQLQVDNCCQRLSSAGRSASFAPSKALPALALAALPPSRALDFDAQPGCSLGSQCAEVTQAPLAIGPPLFVKHCALLS